MNTDSLYQKYYYSKAEFVDGTTQFHRLCAMYVRPGAKILEIGSGPSNATSKFLAALGTVVGADISEEVRHNPYLMEARVYDGHRLPFATGSFDACVADYVIEHIATPEQHFSEVSRVLRPGGVYCFRTPNLWHYVTAASKITPYWLHLRLANRLRCLTTAAHDPHPTVYEANTRGRIRQLVKAAGLSVTALHTIEKEPSYGRASKIIFYPMMSYERIVNSSSALRGIRANILGVVQSTPSKTAVGSPTAI